jgi:mannosyltransferase OCH1-like enzyme
MKAANPTFSYRLFDDNECRAFIEKHFPADIVKAYDTLIPGAYKADLWRLCMLYMEGGIYLDVKFKPMGVGFDQMLDRDYFVKDIGGGVYNAFMISHAKNQKLHDAIRKIVEHMYRSRSHALPYQIPEFQTTRVVHRSFRTICHIRVNSDVV